LNIVVYYELISEELAMVEQTGATIEWAEREVMAEELAGRLSATADDLITRAFAVREAFNHNVDESGVGIHVFSTNDTGSTGKGGDILRAGDLDDIPSQASTVFVITRERKQISRDQEGSKPHGPSPEEEERSGRLGPLTGAYDFARYRHNPRISSDHVDADHNKIDVMGTGCYGGKTKGVLRPASDGSLETAAASTEEKLEAIREIVEAAEARHAANLKRERALPKLISWLRDKLPFAQ